MNIKEELRKNKVYIIVLIVILVLYIVVAFLSIKGNHDGNADGYLIVGDSLIYQKANGDFEQLGDVPDLSNFNFTVYNGDNKVEDVKIQYNSNKWYFFDDDYNEYEFDDFRIAYTDNLDIKPSANRIQGYDDSDDVYIKKVVQTDNNEALQSYRNSLKKLDIDYDGDGKEETLYTITNFSYEVTDYDMIAYLFIVDNGKVEVVESKEGLSSFTMIDSLDMMSDGKYEVIVANEIIDVPTFDSCYRIYGLKDSKFKLLQDCDVHNTQNG